MTFYWEIDEPSPAILNTNAYCLLVEHKIFSQVFYLGINNAEFDSDLTLLKKKRDYSKVGGGGGGLEQNFH